MNIDLLEFASLLSAKEQARLSEVRAALATIDDAVIHQAWETAQFPREVVPTLAEAGLLGNHLHLDGEEPSWLYRGFATFELARKDGSLATFAGVTGSLFGLTVRHFGSAEQRSVLAQIAAGRQVGAFGLTEPNHGSDVAGALNTTARRDGDAWVLNGEKRWIGNATFSDWIVIWARDEGVDGPREAVRGFLVDTSLPGYSATKIEGKQSLRIVQNGHVRLENLRVPDSARLPNIASFRETSEVLKYTRLEVGWAAIGNAAGAMDAALAHAAERTQFGRPLAKFQLVQDLLVANELDLVSALGALVRAAELAGRGELTEPQASLVKTLAAARGREIVRRSRELIGGDGITLERKAVKHFADAESFVTFEGTHQINSLVVGRALTGVSAFV